MGKESEKVIINDSSVRQEYQLLPEFSAELEEIREKGISSELLSKIITKHSSNANYNKQLYKRYMGIQEGVPIYSRQPRYEEENPINNKVSNDFFSEIVDFKVGYFAGEPFSYSYSDTDEAEDTTGGEEATEKAKKALSDFITRNNMSGVDMETTKNASIYGYSGRLFYFDRENNIRVMPISGYETIILSDTSISEPEYAIRYYSTKNINGMEEWTAEFYDSRYRTIFKGGSILTLNEVEQKEHLFDYCPLQGISNNEEHLGDAEKVLSNIDDYDRIVSDNSNEIESFANAMLLINLKADDEVIKKAQKTGCMIVPPVGTGNNNEPVKWLTKNVNDAYTEHHLQRIEDNIYRFSRTPNLSDETFGNATGVSLKFKLHGLETKCATFQSQVLKAAQHMWKVLCSGWKRQGINADPLQFCIEFKRNFPQDDLSTAQTVQAEIASGAPKRFAYRHYTDDPEWLIEEAKSEQEEVMEMYPNLQKTNHTTDDNDDMNDDNKEDENGKGDNNGLQEKEGQGKR